MAGSWKILTLTLVILLIESALLRAETSFSNTHREQYSSRVRLVAEGETTTWPSRTIVITHGCGGTVAGDRFHRLATLLKQAYPAANVFRLDWTSDASEKILGFPNPWAVATKIDPVGDVAAKLLRERGVNATNLTLIGESFGVYVNHRIAVKFGKVAAILGCNPASEAGGYQPPDLRAHGCRTCVITTVSEFDTLRNIAASDYLLTTPAGMNPFEQHTYGINWLCKQIATGDISWIELSQTASPATQESLSGTIMLDGSVSMQPAARTDQL